MRVNIFPPFITKQKGNPFINNLHDSLRSYIDCDYSVDTTVLGGLLKHIFTSDIYILNWPENIIFKKHGVLQYYILRFLLIVLSLRKVRIVWVFHNIEPHQGHNKYTDAIASFMAKNASMILTFSTPAATYLKDKVACRIVVHPHPFKQKMIEVDSLSITKDIDILIWGSIEPYKGVLEFLEYANDKMSKYKIWVCGSCQDKIYAQKIENIANENIIFKNRYASKEELEELIFHSRYVLFPYISKSISSSGALMDTLECGASVIGPNVAAFKDLAASNLCYVYENYKDISDIIGREEYIEREKIRDYINNNTWDKFAQRISTQIIN